MALLRDISLKKNQRSKPACTALGKQPLCTAVFFEHVECGLEAPHYALLYSRQSFSCPHAEHICTTIHQMPGIPQRKIRLRATPALSPALW